MRFCSWVVACSASSEMLLATRGAVPSLSGAWLVASPGPATRTFAGLIGGAAVCGPETEAHPAKAASEPAMTTTNGRDIDFMSPPGDRLSVNVSKRSGAQRGARPKGRQKHSGVQGKVGGSTEGGSVKPLGRAAWGLRAQVGVGGEGRLGAADAVHLVPGDEVVEEAVLAADVSGFEVSGGRSAA